MECLEFVCRAPSDLFKAHRDHTPFVIPRQPGLEDLTSAAELLLERVSPWQHTQKNSYEIEDHHDNIHWQQNCYYIEYHHDNITFV